MTPTNGIDLDQYKTQAKDLIKFARSGDPQALDRLRTHHPEHEKLIASGRIQLADAQLIIARENDFPSWPKFKEHLLFANAVAALDAGDLPKLGKLLDEHPTLLKYRCRKGEWYEEGYFAGAMLLHHIAGNPIRNRLPKDIVDVARLLLSRGADPNAKTEGGWTTIGLLLTGRQPSKAGVSLQLIGLLISAGAKDDLDHPDILTGPLLHGAPETAEELVQRGAKIDIRHAAGLGRLDLLEGLIAGADQTAMEEALDYACVRNQELAVRMLLRHGARGDILMSPGGQTSRTALHEAARRGRRRMVEIILENGADTSVADPIHNLNAAGWAEYGRHSEIADLLRHYNGNQA